MDKSPRYSSIAPQAAISDLILTKFGTKLKSPESTSGISIMHIGALFGVKLSRA